MAEATRRVLMSSALLVSSNKDALSQATFSGTTIHIFFGISDTLASGAAFLFWKKASGEG